MFFLFILSLSSACNEFCSVSCSLFNSPSSCYSLCDCLPSTPELPIPSTLSSLFSVFKEELFTITKCSESSLSECNSFETYSQIFSCFSSSNCSNFAEFGFLADNLSKFLWLAAGPKALVSYIQDPKELEFYKEFDVCQRECYQQFDLFSPLGISLKLFKNCVSACGDKLDGKIDENCFGICTENCPPGREFCMKNCLKKKCGILDGIKKVRNGLGVGRMGLALDDRREMKCPVDDAEFREKHKIEVSN